MIKHITYTPHFPLNQFVDIIWMAKSNHLKLQSSHHAALFTELIFNYKDTFQVKGQNTAHLSAKHGQRLLSGLKTEPFQTTVAGEYGTIGLILKPFCYSLLLKTFDTEVMDKLSDVLYETVFLPEKPDFTMASSQLLRLFKNVTIDPDLLKFENHISSATLQNGSMRAFIASLPITQKSFIQKFKKQYCLTPSQYVKLKQVNYALQLMKQATPPKLTHIGLTAGFYDQSHFIRIFKKFCGKTPKAFQTDLKMIKVNSVQL